MRISLIVPLLLLSPLLAAAPCGAQQGGYKLGESSADGKIEYVWTDTRKGIDVRASGELDLREDAPDVESISPRGYLIVQQRVGSAVHRAEWRPAAGGGVARSYTVDGRRRDFAEARPWLDRFFPEVLRATSIDVRARFRRVLAQRGVSGVLDEAAAAGSGRTRELFLEGLAEHDLTPSEMQRFIQALGGVSSSSTRRELLTALLYNRSALQTGPAAVAWLGAVRQVSSDSDKAALLMASIGRLPAERPVRAAFAETLETLSSDTHYNQVATAYLRSQAERS